MNQITQYVLPGIIIASGAHEFGGMVLVEERRKTKLFKINNESDETYNHTGYADGKIGYHFYTTTNELYSGGNVDEIFDANEMYVYNRVLNILNIIYQHHIH